MILENSSKPKEEKACQFNRLLLGFKETIKEKQEKLPILRRT